MQSVEKVAYDATIALWESLGGFDAAICPERVALEARDKLHASSVVSEDESAAILRGSKVAAFAIGCCTAAEPFHEAQQRKARWDALIA